MAVCAGRRQSYDQSPPVSLPRSRRAAHPSSEAESVDPKSCTHRRGRSSLDMVLSVSALSQSKSSAIAGHTSESSSSWFSTTSAHRTFRAHESSASARSAQRTLRGHESCPSAASAHRTLRKHKSSASAKSAQRTLLLFRAQSLEAGALAGRGSTTRSSIVGSCCCSAGECAKTGMAHTGSGLQHGDGSVEGRGEAKGEAGGDAEYQELHSPKSVSTGALAASSMAHSGNINDLKGTGRSRLGFLSAALSFAATSKGPLPASATLVVRSPSGQADIGFAHGDAGEAAEKLGDGHVVEGVRGMKSMCGVAAPSNPSLARATNSAHNASLYSPHELESSSSSTLSSSAMRSGMAGRDLLRAIPAFRPRATTAAGL
mmetsp:Transcript_30658/g.88903  ORF Transcript_30658/g.88903 Transcript_30658/m.88903 type:complete len:373 (-) Transcript_30658:181-1299(-)